LLCFFGKGASFFFGEGQILGFVNIALENIPKPYIGADGRAPNIFLLLKKIIFSVIVDGLKVLVEREGQGPPVWSRSP